MFVNMFVNLFVELIVYLSNNTSLKSLSSSTEVASKILFQSLDYQQVNQKLKMLSSNLPLYSNIQVHVHHELD